MIGDNKEGLRDLYTKPGVECEKEKGQWQFRYVRYVPKSFGQ